MRREDVDGCMEMKILTYIHIHSHTTSHHQCGRREWMGKRNNKCGRTYVY